MIKIDKNYLLYACASKQDFELVREQRNQFNFKVWRILSLLSFCYFSLLFATTFSVDVVKANCMTDLVLAIICLAEIILLCTVITPESKWLLPLIYIGYMSLLGFGIMIGVVLSPQYLAVTYHVLLISLPLFIVDKPFRMGIMELISAGVFVALCIVCKTGETRELDIYNVFMFALLGQVVNYSMANAKMQQFLTAKKIEIASFTDDLTQMYNRKAYEMDMLELQNDAAADKAVLVTFDVNGLKSINDTLGHNAGDELLKGAADSIRVCFAPHGKTYRIGGDEFVAIIHTTQKELDAVEKQFEKTVVAWHGKYVPGLSVAMGYAARWEHPDTPAVELAKIADRRMYDKKRAYYAASGLDRRRR